MATDGRGGGVVTPPNSLLRANGRSEPTRMAVRLGRWTLIVSMPPRTTVAQVRGMALAMTRLVFAGDTAEVIETIKSNVRNIPQAT